ncbi:MAG: VWA domain-containing protein [Anaerolineae bacterium]|nr:VWA domain-containing protein [Anaerolineae bacterium]
MPYSAEISRSNPTCFLFVIDRSGSMEDPFPNEKRRKAEGVADAINRLLQNLVIRCAKEEGVRDYFHVGVIGYGEKVGPAFSGALAGRDLAPISEIANLPARVEERTKKVDDGAGGLMDQTVRFPIWFDPVYKGGTHMCQALAQARGTLEYWLTHHPDCFPPIVIHITDGESTDGDPTEEMKKIKALASTDGEVLLFNVHLSDKAKAMSTAFPDTDADLPDDYARKLFNGASALTPFMRSVASEQGFALSDGARGFVMNADLVLVIQALEIGTRPSNLR